MNGKVSLICRYSNLTDRNWLTRKFDLEIFTKAEVRGAILTLAPSISDPLRRNLGDDATGDRSVVKFEGMTACDMLDRARKSNRNAQRLVGSA